LSRIYPSILSPIFSKGTFSVPSLISAILIFIPSLFFKN
jgi:hypothetical protein